MNDIYQDSMNKIRELYGRAYHELNSIKTLTREDMEKVIASTTEYMDIIHAEVKILREGYMNVAQYEGHFGSDLDTELSQTIALAEMKYINEALFLFGTLRRSTCSDLKNLHGKVLSPELAECCEDSSLVAEVDEDGWALFHNAQGKGFWMNVVNGVLFVSGTKYSGRNKDHESRVVAPESQALLDAVNKYFGTVFFLEYFEGEAKAYGEF